jgi:hypothetical protein
MRKVVDRLLPRCNAFDKRLAEEEARWTEIETRLMHGKALYEAAQSSDSVGL